MELPVGGRPVRPRHLTPSLPTLITAQVIVYSFWLV